MKRLSLILVPVITVWLAVGNGGGEAESAAPDGSGAAAKPDAGQGSGSESLPTGPVSAALTPTVDGPSRIKYRLEQGKSYAYKIRTEADLGERVLVTQAGCYYSVEAPDKAAPTSDKPPTATGTAFVIHADGYLVTCEHVVDDAQKIEVTLGGKSYPATVFAVDEALDVALLKIDGRGLPTLALGDSESVQVGEDVRAIGYPLSGVLGVNPKTTRGSISGIEELDGRRTFQIDASVNGGNSGGPLVSEAGHVVGIVNAKLTGSEISGIGFAVPINYAKQMLAERKLSFTPATANIKLDGSELVKRTNPCVALVTATLDKGGAAGAFNLHVSGHISRSERQKRFTPGQRPIIGAGGNLTFGARTPVRLKVDSQGTVHEFDGEDALPFMLGNAPLLIFEPFPKDGRRSWKTQQQIILESKNSQDQDRNEPGFGFGRPSLGPRGPIGPRLEPRFGPDARLEGPVKPQVTYHPALEIVSYEVESQQGDLVTIRKEYELRTTGGTGSLKLETSGSGTIQFDTRAGMPKQMNYEGTFSVTQGLLTAKVPFTATYELTESKPAQASATTPKQPKPNGGALQQTQPPTRPSALKPAAALEPEFKPLAGNPKIAVWAPKSYQKYTPEMAFDGDPKTFWNAGGWPEQWIEVDLMESKSLAGIKLTMPNGKSKPGDTVHEIWVSDKPLGQQRGEGRLAHTFRGETNWGDVLQADFPAGTSGRYVQVRSTKSRSWIAWGEIEIKPAGK